LAARLINETIEQTCVFHVRLNEVTTVDSYLQLGLTEENIYEFFDFSDLEMENF